MIIILLFLILMLLSLIIFDLHSALSKWLVATIFGLVLAVFSLIVYSVNMWDYSYFVRKVLLLNNRSLYLWVYYLNLGAFTTIRLLNFGIVMFIYCTTVFSFEYFHYITYKSRRKFKYLLSILPLVYLVGYDPFMTNVLYHLFFHLQSPFLHANVYFNIIKIFNVFNKIWMVGYFVLSLAMIIRSLTCAYHDQIKHRTIMLSANLLTLYLIFNIIFYWIPRIMFTPRGLGLSGNSYAQPYVGLNIKFIESNGYYLLILFTAISAAFFLISMYKYNMISLSSKKHKQYFDSSYKYAYTSSQVFTHAFKNDIFAIQTLSRNPGNEDTPEFLESRLKSIYDVSIECMNRLDLLHRRTTKPVLKLETVKVTDLTHDSIKQMFSSLPPQINIEVLPFNSDLAVVVDRIQIVEVLRNIFTNSVESMSNEKGNILVTISKKSRWAVIEISDDGCGISKEMMKKIFTPYYSTKPSTKNWGLGLSFCRKIVQLMDGDIYVESVEGKGSKFCIYLPLPPLKK